MPKIVRFGFTWGNNILLNSILVILAPKFRLRTSSDKGSKNKSKLNKNSYFGTEVITKAKAQSGLEFDKKNGKSNVQNYDLRCLRKQIKDFFG